MNGIKYQRSRLKLAMRRQKIKDFYAKPGISLKDVAAEFSISRGRAWQIVRDYSK
jgi:hypothetical protein